MFIEIFEKMVEVKHISEAVEKIDLIEEDDLQTLLNDYTSTQKALINYILMTCESFSDNEIASLAMYYYAVFYESFLNSGGQMNTLGEKEVEDFLDSYLPILELEDAEKMSADMLKLIEQEVLFGFLINEIMAEDEEGGSMDDAERQKMYILGTLMIGLLNKAAA